MIFANSTIFCSLLGNEIVYCFKDQPWQFMEKSACHSINRFEIIISSLTAFPWQQENKRELKLIGLF